MDRCGSSKGGFGDSEGDDEGQEGSVVASTALDSLSGLVLVVVHHLMCVIECN